MEAAFFQQTKPLCRCLDIGPFSYGGDYIAIIPVRYGRPIFPYTNHLWRQQNHFNNSMESTFPSYKWSIICSHYASKTWKH